MAAFFTAYERVRAPENAQDAWLLLSYRGTRDKLFLDASGHDIEQLKVYLVRALSSREEGLTLGAHLARWSCTERQRCLLCGTCDAGSRLARHFAARGTQRRPSRCVLTILRRL